MKKVPTRHSEMLKELAIKWRDTRDSKVFATFLKKVDKLLIRVVKQLKAKSALNLGKIPAQELYHTAMIGMSDALVSIRDEEKSEWIVTRVCVYARDAIYRDYRYKIQESRAAGKIFTFSDRIRRKFECEDSIIPKVELTDEICEFMRLVYAYKILCNSDDIGFAIFLLRSLDHSYEDCAHIVGLSIEETKKRARKVVLGLRRFFNRIGVCYVGQ